MRCGLAFLIFLTALLSASAALAAAPAPLIVISIDAFRADYFGRGQTPTLAMLARDGVRATAMRPAFPSLTFPNHYTLVTGLYPDHHGIIDNVMSDPAISPDKFTMSSANREDPHWWEEATPLWVSAQQQNEVMASAGWPGSEGLIHDRRPNYIAPWRANRDPAEIAAVTLNWLDLPPALRPAISFLYFDDVDHAGHDHGPSSPEVDAAIRKVDAALGTLVAGLKRRGLFAQTNIVIVSDHGMADSANARTEVIDDLAGPGLAVIRSFGTTAGIDALPGHDGEAAAVLLAPHAHFSCWRKSEIPARFHYGSNPRIPQFVCLGRDGWRLTTRADKAKWTREHPGSHGFDPSDPSMAALFIAHGPAFRRGVTLAPFDNVDVYPLLARIGGVAPEKNDGNIADLAPALK